METASLVDGDFWDGLDGFQAACNELAQLSEVSDVAEGAMALALELTGSSFAFIRLDDGTAERNRVFSRCANTADTLPADLVERIVEAADSASGAVAETIESRIADPSFRSVRSYLGQPLNVAGRVIGIIGVASTADYTAMQRGAFSVFANQVAAALEIAQLQERHQVMVETLVNLRSELERSEKQRLLDRERAQSAERVEKAHEAAVAALHAVSIHARSGHNLSDFYRRLTTSIAELVGADKVLFWQLTDNGMLAPIAGAHGVDQAIMARLDPTPCAPERNDLVSNVVFKDFTFRASRDSGPAELVHVLDALGVRDAISVAWRAGDQRLGLVAAYDSARPEGFSREDTWVLQKAGLAAGLVWQLRFAENDLEETVERLQKVDAARQLLLKNVSTAVDKARSRFASELHDDALQRLTAAELQLQRLSESSDEIKGPITETQSLLAQTEEALRRLLFELRPPALELPGGLSETIRDRVNMLRSQTGADVELELEVPDELTLELKSLLFRQVAEILSNVEKHAAATKVLVSLKLVDGAVHGRVVDNGSGFVVSERDHLPGHLGLLALNERALFSGGWARVESEPGRGTTVEFWMPTG